MGEKSLQRILYAEDEPDIQTIARIALETVGNFTLEICSSGNEAIEKAPGFKPDLVLLDVMMPGMDGPTTMKKLREIGNITDTPVIFMTAKAQRREISQFKAMGALDVIPKPFDPMRLAENVRTIWEQHRASL